MALLEEMLDDEKSLEFDGGAVNVEAAQKLLSHLLVGRATFKGLAWNIKILGECKMILGEYIGE